MSNRDRNENLYSIEDTGQYLANNQKTPLIQHPSGHLSKETQHATPTYSGENNYLPSTPADGSRVDQLVY